ncbi:ATP-binding protein [Aureimonas sp. ME7]|uniref:ATP-binding protein n=1 Tax=Aureimonas sp. ME7 TaxID=2744252 RepID=UPI0015F5383C|nr:ATP-binding protein [Aureimonas sp. ME7]
MALTSVSRDEFQQILASNLTPSATIKTPELLFGRERALTQIERALASQGRQVFIYGDRGVGKTSLALTAAHLLNGSTAPPIYVVCSQNDKFEDVIRAIGVAVLRVEERFEKSAAAATIGATFAGFGGSFKGADKTQTTIAAPTSLNEALDIVRFVLSKRSGQTVIVIDEMERIGDAAQREKFAEFIKNIPELSDRIKFIFCGIASTVNELIGTHPSAGRVIEPINLEKLHHNYLWDIIRNVAEKLNVAVEREALVRIGQISDGFPHYVHLIGESLFYAAYDDPYPVDAIRASHFKAGIRGALERAEAMLRTQYEKATMKTKNTADYEDALWSLADTTSDRRQLTEIYESSYKRIFVAKGERSMLARDKFNQRLLALRSEGHGKILIGYGSGWFGFRENIMRGYVRLRAENAGVSLGRDNVVSI